MLLFVSGLHGQKNLNLLGEEFENLTLLDDSISIDYNGQLIDFVSFLSQTSGLTVGIDDGDARMIKTSFVNTTVRDVIDYLIYNYDFVPRRIGNIIHLEVKEQVELPQKEIQFTWDSMSHTIVASFRLDTLTHIASIVSRISDVNVVIDKRLNSELINGYYKNVSVPRLFELISESALLKYSYDSENKTVYLAPRENSESGSTRNSERSRGNINITRVDSLHYSIRATDAEPLAIIELLLQKSNANYYLFPSSNRTVMAQSQRRPSNETIQSIVMDVFVQNVEVEELLEALSYNSELDCRKIGNQWIVGSREAEGIYDVRIIELMNRSARNIMEMIPLDRYPNIVVDSLFENNSLIVTGNNSVLDQLEEYIESVDVTVPLVHIELFIVDVQEGNLRDIGIEAGEVNGGREFGGSVISGNGNENSIDFSFSPAGINRILELLSGRGIINLGPVSSDFYLSLKAVEEDGIIEIESTPKLSTLNNHLAQLSIGQKRYYLEQQVNFSGVDNPIPIQANRFQEVEANLDINIRPVVSGNEHVTLDISFEQSEFIGEFDVNIPPPQVSRKFQSMIRVKNEEMIVLGGLEKETKVRNKRGVPWISRIPVLGWLFGRHRREDSEDKLLIFVKPTVTYK